MQKFSLLSILVMFTFLQVNAQLAVPRSSSTLEYLSDPTKNSYEVIGLNVDADINGQMANVTVTQTIHNPGNRSLEVEIFFPLPEQAAIRNLTLLVDGHEFPGELMTKEEATRIYEGIVRRQQDPALMEYVGSGLFKTSVFPVPRGQTRKITISYSAICTKQYDLITFKYPLGTQKFSATALKEVTFNLRITSPEGISNVYSPTDEITTKRQNKNEVLVTMEKKNVLPEADFQLIYSLSGGTVGANLISYKPTTGNEGYFMLMASPLIEKKDPVKISKTVIFVLDRSGSMHGQKIEQSKKAIEFVLGNLNEDDLFNIITFDDRIVNYKPELQRYNSTSYKEAMDYVRQIRPGGGTNINDALTTAMKMFGSKSTPNYLIFLTDGAPTSGITNEMQIAENCKAANNKNVRLFSFGVGAGVNARLLDRLSVQNSGISDYVQHNNELEAVISRFYSSISDPVLTNIEIDFKGIQVSDIYPRQIPDLFKGGQLILAGKYTNPGKATITIRGKIGTEPFTMDVPVEFASEKDGASNAFVEQLWATRRIGFIMEQIDLNGRNDELVEELVSLSTRHGILTPFTAFLAREDVDFRNASRNMGETNQQLERLNNTQGYDANHLRMSKNAMVNASSVPSKSFSPTGNVGNQHQNLQNIGNRTFYMRNGNWVESTVSEEDEKQAITIERFSNEYFQLARSNSAEVNQYMAMDGNVVLKLDKIYLIR